MEYNVYNLNSVKISIHGSIYDPRLENLRQTSSIKLQLKKQTIKELDFSSHFKTKQVVFRGQLILEIFLVVAAVVCSETVNCKA